MSHSSNSVPPVHFHQVDEELVTEKNAALQKKEEETKEHGMGPSGALATCINVSMGTGWLTLPYAFWRTGIVPGILLTIFFAIITNMGKDFFLESVVRCEALAQARDPCATGPRKSSTITLPQSMMVKDDGENEEKEQSIEARVVGSDLEMASRRSPCPHYELTHRKWELSQCAHFLLAPWACLLVGGEYTVWVWGTMIEFCQIFAVSCASILGSAMFGLPLEACADPGAISFGSACYPAYCVFLAIFIVAILVIAIAGLRETYWFQIFMTIMRFVVLLLMCFTLILEPGLESFKEGLIPMDATEMSKGIWFDISGLGFAAGAIIFSLGNCDTAPAVGQAMNKKSRYLLPHIYLGSTVILSIFYTFVAVIASYYISSQGYVVFATINNAWNRYGGSNPTWWQLIIRYLVVLFAPMDVISAAPVRAITLTNNLAGMIFRNTENRGDLGEGFTLRRALFFVAALALPFTIAWFVTSVSHTLALLGVLSVCWQYVFPVVFVFVAVRQCRAYFGEEDGRKGGHYRLFYSVDWVHILFMVLCAFLVVFEILAMLSDYGVPLGI